MSRAAELIDRATDNPAFDGLGGYYIFQMKSRHSGLF